MSENNLHIVIGPAMANDLDAVVELHLRALEEELSKSAAASFRRIDRDRRLEIVAFFRDAMVSDHFCILTAQTQGEIIGFTLACQRSQLGESPESVGMINGAYVLPEYRGQGIASQLAHAALNWMRMRGLTAVELNATLGEHGVEGFWRKLGFEPLELVMIRKL